ncbi:MAG: hypothetical protein QW803_12555 [Candidatus Methanomethylicia archaeon]
MSLTPISAVDIMISLGYMLTKWIFLGMIFSHIVMRRFFNKITIPSFFSLIVISGASINVIINMFLLFINIFNKIVVWILNLVIGVLMLRVIFEIYNKKFSSVNSGHMKSFIIIALLILFVRLDFLYGEFTYPGDDPKFFSLISRRLIEEGGLPVSWGVYAKEEWLVEKLQLFMIGFPSLVAEITIATGIPIYKAVALATQIVVWITSLAMHFLLEVITEDWRTGIYGMLIYGLFILEPSLSWITWGGNAELAGLPYMILTISLTIAYLKGYFNYSIVLPFSIILASTIITHPFPLIYFLTAFISIILTNIVLYENYKKVLQCLLILIISVLISIFLTFPILLNMIFEELNAKKYYEPSINPFWTPIFSLNQTIYEAAISFFSRVYVVYGFAGILFIPIIVFLILKRRHLSIKKKKTEVLLLCFWWMLLFFLHENNPNGLWLVKVPFWYRVDPNRTFCMTSFPLSAMEAILMNETFLTFSEDRRKRIISLLTSKFTIIVYLAILIATLLMLHGCVHASIAPYTMLGEDDAKIFQKILDFNIEGIFVMPNDAGQWIPAILGRPVIIPMGVATRHEVMNTYYLKIYPTLCKDPCSPLVAKYFAENNVNYIYVGGKQGHLEIYPYMLTKDLANSCGTLKPVIMQGKAALYKYEQPEIIRLSELYLEPEIIGSGGTHKIFYSKDTISITLNDSWVALSLNFLNFTAETNTFDYSYICLKWWTEKKVHLVVEALLGNGTLTRLTEPISAAYFFKWGNGTINWVSDYYIRIPHNSVQIRFIMGGQGTGKLDRTITLIRVRTRD